MLTVSAGRGAFKDVTIAVSLLIFNDSEELRATYTVERNEASACIIEDQIGWIL